MFKGELRIFKWSLAKKAKEYYLVNLFLNLELNTIASYDHFPRGFEQRKAILILFIEFSSLLLLHWWDFMLNLYGKDPGQLDTYGRLQITLQHFCKKYSWISFLRTTHLSPCMHTERTHDHISLKSAQIHSWWFIAKKTIFFLVFIFIYFWISIMLHFVLCLFCRVSCVQIVTNYLMPRVKI